MAASALLQCRLDSAAGLDIYELPPSWQSALALCKPMHCKAQPVLNHLRCPNNGWALVAET